MIKKTLTKTLLAVSFICFFANISQAQTTLEEYNYITKGLKIQKESGLDMKKGYVIEHVRKFKNGTQEATLQSLRKMHTDSLQTVAYIIIYKFSETSTPYYYCLPHPKSSKEVRDLAFNALLGGTANSPARLQTMLMATTFGMEW